MTGDLPDWLGRLLGVDAAGSGHGTGWRLEHFWRWPAWATLLFVLAVAALVVWVYLTESGAASRRRRSVLAALRLATIGLVLLMIAGWVLALAQTDLPYVVVLVDTSGSMAAVDRVGDEKAREKLTQRLKATGYDEATRLNLARTLLAENDAALWQAIADKYRVKLYFVAEAATAAQTTDGDVAAALRSAAATGDSSRLGDGVRQALEDLSGNPVAAVVLFSDGITTEGRPLADAAQYCRRRGAPLSIVALGSDEPLRDLELSDLLVEEVVFVDDVVQFEVRLGASGFRGRQANVVLREAQSGRELARKTIDLASDAEQQTVRVPYRPTAVGEVEYEVQVEPQPEETNVKNNVVRRLVSVRRQKVRVLLVQSEPSYEFRFLKHLLERDGTVDVKVVLQDADPDYPRIDPVALPSFPVRRDDVLAYDVLILGDANPAGIGATGMEHVRDLVTQRAGGAVFIAGPRFNPTAYADTPLAELLPIDVAAARRPDPQQTPAEFQVVPTELGLSHPPLNLADTPADTLRLFKSLPPLQWRVATPKIKRGAQVWLEHASETTPDGQRLPLAVLHYVNAGKVLFHAFDGTYRWRAGPDERHYARYWIGLVRYLARAKLLGSESRVEVATDRREYRRGMPIRVSVRFFAEQDAPPGDDAVRVTLVRDDNSTQPLSLQRHATNRGLFTATLSDVADGRYQARLAQPTVAGRTPSAEFVVRPPPGETERLQVDFAELSAVTKASGGKLYTFDTARDLPDDLPPGRHVAVRELPAVTLWNSWPLSIVVLTLLTAEWLLRKRSGML